jgi:hypothetical protein
MDEATVSCPYCGETIVLDVEAANLPQRYVEDCPVCCRPIEIHAQPDPAGRLERLETCREGD